MYGADAPHTVEYQPLPPIPLKKPKYAFLENPGSCMGSPIEMPSLIIQGPKVNQTKAYHPKRKARR